VNNGIFRRDDKFLLPFGYPVNTSCDREAGWETWEDRAGRRKSITTKEARDAEKVKIFGRINRLFTTFQEIVDLGATQSIHP
jgi:hypothetical protein